MKKRVVYLPAIVLLFLSACNINMPQQQTPSTPTSTATVSLLAITDTPPSANTAPAPADDSLCDNDYFPNDDDTAWTYQGNNSKIGSYTRTDTVTDSTDEGFTITTQLPDVTYTQELTCTEAGLINMNPAAGDLTAIFSGPSGTAVVNRIRNSGITIPRKLDEVIGDTWQQIFGWEAITSQTSNTGEFIYYFTAMGLEVVTVPYGSFDAMRIDARIEMEIGDFPTMDGTYTASFWFVKDVGLVKSDGSMKLPGVDFTDSIELVSYDSP